MMTDNLKKLFARDLNKLKAEIQLYHDEKKIWTTGENISNSAGNLCLHLVGNLNAYIGVGLANTNYTRQRELEFSLKDIARVELIQKIEATMQVVETGLNNLREGQLQEEFPILIWDKPTETGYTLIHLLTHLNYHLGQINYHRRLLDK